MSHTHSYRTDEEILEGLRRGDPASAEALFDHFADRIHGFGLKASRRSEDARDILHETLVQAVRSVKDIKHAKALPRWLYRVASAAILAREPADGKEIPIEALTPERRAGVTSPIHDWSLDPDEEIRRQEEKLLLKEAVAALPSHYRLVLVLRDMEEISEHDVSDILQIQESTVKFRLHRSRLFVRKELTRRLTENRGSVRVS
ncbi:MAG: sigma-70 family RNA polymerase sigma factor [Acidobacteria bacterium]|nr:sigma-70 family RNA polymerase sigma factor [Acidobacteriota bacterium]